LAVIKKKLGRPRKIETQIAVEPKKIPQEKQIHKDAYKFYFDLGANRNFQAVAAKFKVSAHYVRYWAKRYLWADRINAIENRTIAEVIDSLDQQVILERFRMMWKEHPEKPGVLVLDPGIASVGAIKDLTAAHVNLDRNSRDRVLEREDKGGGTGVRNRKQGVIVNVNILNKTVPSPGV
jgi:hypothetical protein